MKTLTQHYQYIFCGSSKSHILLFISHFILFLTPALLILEIIESVPVTSAIVLNTISFTAGKLAALVGTQNLYQNGNMLLHVDSGRYLIIDHTCSGLALTATFLAGLAAFRCHRRHYFILVIVFVQCLNLIRIVHLFFLINKSMEQFAYYHLYVWQIVNFVCSCMFFIALLWRLTHESK